MIGRLIANDVHDAGASTPRIVEIAHAVCEARATMEQCASWLARNPVITVSHASDNVLLKAENTMHAWDAIERSDEVHLAGARIGEACVDAGIQEE